LTEKINFILCVLLLIMFNYHIHTLYVDIESRDRLLSSADYNLDVTHQLMIRMNLNQTYLRNCIDMLEYQVRTGNYEVEYHKNIKNRYVTGNYYVIAIISYSGYTYNTCFPKKMTSFEAYYTMSNDRDTRLHNIIYIHSTQIIRC
jgi:hypothetical protein